MKKFFTFLFTAFILFTPFCSKAEVSKLKFTTEPQTIKPNVVSSKITIQLQDNSGIAQKAEGTFRFTLEANSSTGRFVTSGGNAVESFYISSGSASRSFYYTDSTLGSYTLKVSTTSPGILSDEQTIIISENASAAISSSNEENDQNASSTEDKQDSSVETASGSYSSHSSQSSLSNISVSSIKIGAGRKRLASAGSTVSFGVYHENNSYPYGTRFWWSFGDGTAVEGDKVSHTYQFPGEYNVVLNATSPDGRESVSRTTVLVDDPKFVISDLNQKQGYIEIWNKGDREANINDWFLVSGAVSYRLPRDTIIKARSKIKIPLVATKLEVAEPGLFLVRPDGKLTSTFPVIKKVSLTSSQTREEKVIAEVSTKLTQIQKEVDKISLAEKEGRYFEPLVRVPQGFNPKSQLTGASLAFDTLLPALKATDTAPTASATVIVLKKERNFTLDFWKKIKSWFGD